MESLRKQREKDMRREQIQNVKIYSTKVVLLPRWKKSLRGRIKPGTIYYYFKNKEELYL
jgi:hypothetical protein